VGTPGGRIFLEVMVAAATEIFTATYVTSAAQPLGFLPHDVILLIMATIPGSPSFVLF
jgi:hypothetical protein